MLTELASGKLLPRPAPSHQRAVRGRRSETVVGDPLLAEIEAAIPGLRRILAGCLQPLPEKRHPSAAVLLSELETLRRHVGLQHRLPDWLASSFRPTPRPKQVARPRRADMETEVIEGGAESTVDLAASTLIFQPEVRPRTNLGPPVDGYVGRRADLETLVGHFESGSRLITVKGTGGAGKTRFTRRVARSRVDALPGGAWFVDLTEARTPRGIAHATALALEVPLRTAELDGMVSQVGQAIAGRGSVLMVFDNFEQVVEHAAGTLGRWLTMAPDARFLVTSREPLQLPGEQIFPLDPLTEAESVELFELRARAGGALWTQTPQSRAAIVGIVDKLDRLPLAIELAAARARLLSPTQLLDRLSERFKLLHRGGQKTTGRQASLRGLVDWSWGLLEPWERSALAQLSVFRDGFFMEAAEAVLDLAPWPDAPWSLDVVGALLDKSLLYSREIHGQPRFGMYGTIQEYATEKLGADFSGPVARHAKHFAFLGTEAYHATLYTHEGVKQRNHLTLEFENLLAAVDLAPAAGVPEAAVGCALAGAEVFRLHGPFADGIDLLERISGLPSDHETQQRWFRKTAWLQYLAGRIPEALEHYSQALSISREVGSRQSEGGILGMLAIILRDQGRVAEAQEHYNRALSICREVGNRRGEGDVLGNLGNFHYAQGRVAVAAEHYEQALAIHREMGVLRGEGVVLTNLAHLHRDQGQLVKALEYYNRALSIARTVGDRRSLGNILGDLAAIHSDQGQLLKAQDYCNQALVIHREVGDRRFQGICLGNLGDILSAQGDLSSAAAHLREAIAINDENWTLAAGAFRGSLALIQAQQGASAEARVLIELGEPQVRGVHKSELVKFLCKKARVEHMAGEPEAAAATLAEAEAIDAELGSRPDSERGQAITKARMELLGTVD